MGFAPVVATAILMMTAMFAAGVYLQDWHGAQKNVQSAERDAARLHDERTHTEMTLVTSQYQNGPDRLTVTVANTGDTVLRASELEWVLDGVWQNGVIESTTVDGSPTQDLWIPGKELVIQFRPVDPAPTTLVLTSGNGAQEVTSL